MSRPQQDRSCGSSEVVLDSDGSAMASADMAAAIVAAIRRKVEDHIHVVDGPIQWWVDEFTIDCNAEEFWRVVEAATREVVDAKAAPFTFPATLTDEELARFKADWVERYGSRP